MDFPLPLSFKGEGDTRGEVDKQPSPSLGKGKRGGASL